MNKEFPLCYKTFGKNSNPCIILIMGIGGQLIDWPSAFTDELVKNAFYVVTFDNRDSGLSRHYDECGTVNFNEIASSSQKNKLFTPPYSLEDMAADVIMLMDELRIQTAHIAGISMGGIIAQYVALNFTDRVHSLICIASTSGDPQLPPPKQEVLDFFANSMNTQPQSLEQLINNKLKLLKIYNHPDYFDEKKATNQLTAAFQRANYPEGFKRLTLAMICAKPRTDRLKKLKVPCLIIQGDADPVFSIEHGKHLAECIEHSHLEIIKKLGHGLPDFFCKKIADLITRYLNKIL